MSTPVTIMKSPTDLPLIAAQFKALGDATRLELMVTVAGSANSEACVCDLTPDTGLTQGTVSHHLRILVEAGLLERSQRGKWSYYSLTTAAEKLLASFNIAIPLRVLKQDDC